MKTTTRAIRHYRTGSGELAALSYERTARGHVVTGFKDGAVCEWVAESIEEARAAWFRLFVTLTAAGFAPVVR